jgi:hypothetical protein
MSGELGRSNELFVETASPSQLGGGSNLRVFAEELWRASSVGIWTSQDEATESPLSRVRIAVRIGQDEAWLDVVYMPGHWVGGTVVRGFKVTVEGINFPLEELKLVEVDDLRPYVNGSRQFDGAPLVESDDD